jgi:heme/copper-type cytochrome/quinol oxidase subunit 2
MSSRARLALLTALALALPALASACPACKNALADDPAAQGFAKGIYLSIILMLGVFFSLVGFLVWKLVRMAQDEAPSPGR